MCILNFFILWTFFFSFIAVINSFTDGSLVQVRLLGPGLIETQQTGAEPFYKPVTLLPNVIELNYYANALLPVFVLDAVVGMAILKLIY